MFVRISSGMLSSVGGADILLRSTVFGSYTDNLCRGFPRSGSLWFSKSMVDVEGKSSRCYMMDVLATSDS
jgi:hypothetical protein